MSKRSGQEAAAAQELGPGCGAAHTLLSFPSLWWCRTQRLEVQLCVLPRGACCSLSMISARAGVKRMQIPQ